MKMSIHAENDLVVVTIDGNVMQEYVAVFKTRLEDLISTGKTRIILDMKDASYMSSMCLAVIVDAKNKSQAAGGDVKIASANKLVANLLEITNLTRKIQLFDTVEKAREAFGQVAR